MSTSIKGQSQTTNQYGDYAALNNNSPPAPSSNSNNLFIASGYGAALVKAFQEILDYLSKLMQQNGEAAAVFAKLNSDPKTSFYSSFINSRMTAADKEGSQLSDAAIGEFVSAGIGGASLLASGAGEFANRPGGDLNTKDVNAQSYKNLFSEKPNGDLLGKAENEEIEMKEMNTNSNGENSIKQEVTEDQELKDRRQAITDGSYHIESYKTGNAKDDELTENAVKSLSEEDRKEAIKQADKHAENIQNEKQSYSARQNKLLNNYIDPLNRSLSAGAQGGSQVAQAGDKTDASRESASAEVTQMFIQNQDSMKEKSLQNQQTSQEQMNSAVQQMTSALISSTKANG